MSIAKKVSDTLKAPTLLEKTVSVEVAPLFIQDSIAVATSNFAPVGEHRAVALIEAVMINENRHIYSLTPFVADCHEPKELSNHPELIRRLGPIVTGAAIEANIYGNVHSTHFSGS